MDDNDDICKQSVGDFHRSCLTVERAATMQRKQTLSHVKLTCGMWGMMILTEYFLIFPQFSGHTEELAL